MMEGKPTTFSVNLFTESQEYWVGSEIEGNVFLEVSKEMMPIKAIKLVLSGVAHVIFSDGNIQGSTVYSNSEDICTVIWTIWSNDNNYYQEQVFSTSLSAGRYKFPFKIHLPSDLALPASYESTNGFIRYSLIASISRSQEEKLEHTATEAITIKSIVNTNVPQLMQPMSLSVTIDRGVYRPGELIAINVKAENQSTKRIKSVCACLVQTVTYCGQAKSLFGSKHQRKYRINRIIHKIEGPGIAAGETGCWNDELLLIPATLSTIAGHHIIQLLYTVDVTLLFHKADKLNVLIPITIGTTSFQQRTEHYSQLQGLQTGTVPPPPYQLCTPSLTPIPIVF